MDVLSDILAFSHVSGSVLAEIDCRGDWAIDMLDSHIAGEIQNHAMPFHYMIEGEGYLVRDGVCMAVGIGDLIVAPSWPRHAVVSDPALPQASIVEIIAANGFEAWDGGLINRPLRFIAGQGDRDARLLSGVFRIEGHAVAMLLKELPPLLKLSIDDRTLDEQFATALSFVRQETAEIRPGYVAVAGRLTDLLFIQILRSCMATAEADVGVLAALSDTNIARALMDIHESPSAPWTVSSLAGRAHLSRTLFAERFRDLVGQTPIQYVNRWRIVVAQDLLLTSDLPIGEIQLRLGFASSFAFSRVFRQITGMSPSAYRKAGAAP